MIQVHQRKNCKFLLTPILTFQILYVYSSVFREFFFETDYHDDPDKKYGLSGTTAIKGAEKMLSSAKEKGKSKKNECLESEPLLNLTSSEDFLRSDSKSVDESDALLLELASLDLGLLNDTKAPNQSLLGDDVSNAFSNEENYAATLGEIFGGTSSKLDNQWSQFLPSQILGNELGNDSNVWSDFVSAPDNIQSSGSSKAAGVNRNADNQMLTNPGSKKVLHIVLCFILISTCNMYLSFIGFWKRYEPLVQPFC